MDGVVCSQPRPSRHDGRPGSWIMRVGRLVLVIAYRPRGSLSVTRTVMSRLCGEGTAGRWCDAMAGHGQP